MLVNKAEFLEVQRSGIPKMIPYSLEWRQYWTEQRRRCLEGYSVGGVWMPPQLYYYGNFHHIRLNDKNKDRRRKSLALPSVTDLEWELAFIYDECKNEPNKLRVREGRVLLGEDNIYRPLEAGTLGAAIGGARDSGKSYFASGIGAHEYTFYAGNEIIISASGAGYTGDLLSKIRTGLDNLNGGIELGIGKKAKKIPSPFSHQRIKNDWNDEVRSGYLKKGDDSIHGYNTVIWNIIYGNNSMAANGKRPSFHVFEEAGAWDGGANLSDCIRHSKACWMNGTEQFAVPWIQGTGGNMKKGTKHFKRIWENPQAFNLITFEDIYERKGKISYFIPATKGARQFKDENGNTRLIEAVAHYEHEREELKKNGNQDDLMAYMMYYPLKPSEMFLKSSANIFPTRELLAQQAYIEGNDEIKALERRGWLLPNAEGELEWKEDNDLVACDFPMEEGADKEGCIQIWELPDEFVQAERLYIAGTDPYDQDDSTTTSLGSTFIFKRFNTFGRTYDWIVAEYTARPSRSEIYYENVRRLLMFYHNALDLYENNLKGFLTHMRIKNSLHLLAEQPENVIKDIVKDTTVERGYGVHMIGPIKRQFEIYGRDYLLEEYAPGKYNYQKVFSLGLIKELIDYDSDGNYDRVIAFLLCIVQRLEMWKAPVQQDELSTEEIEDYWELDPYAR